MKEKAERLFNGIGLDLTSAIRLFLTQSVIQQKIPFESYAPEFYNQETLNALDEGEKILDGKEKGKFFYSIEEARNYLECAENPNDH